jgi:hypothetical protein
MNDFLKALISNIVENKFMPKVQVERQISPILDVFISDLINQLSLEGKIIKGDYDLIASEFPSQLDEIINKKRTLRSSNIDYLFLNKITKSLLLVELKTDSKSFNLLQYKSYLEVVKRINEENAGFFGGFLSLLTNPKYKLYLKAIEEKVSKHTWEQIKSAKVIYFAPKKIKTKKWGIENRKAINEISFIHFEDFPFEIEHTFKEEWKIVRKGLLELDKN